MKIRDMNDQILLRGTHELIALECKTIQQILVHLQEIYDRKLFAKLGYSNLIQFMIKELKLSESSAYRRYQALKLTREIPAAAKMIEDGTLSLCSATKLQTMMNGESSELKTKALEAIQDKSVRESEQIIFKLCPEAEKRVQKKDRVVTIGSTTVRLECTIKKSTLDKLDQLKARTKKYETAELLDLALDIALKQTDPQAIKTRKSKGSINPRIIPAETKRQVYAKAHGKCQYPGCKEIHFLEIDHILPVFKKGENQLGNLQLLCKAHHQLKSLGDTSLSRQYYMVRLE